MRVLVARGPAPSKRARYHAGTKQRDEEARVLNRWIDYGPAMSQLRAMPMPTPVLSHRILLLPPTAAVARRLTPITSQHLRELQQGGTSGTAHDRHRGLAKQRFSHEGCGTGIQAAQCSINKCGSYRPTFRSLQFWREVHPKENVHT